MNESQRTYDRIIGPIEEQMIRSIWRIVRNQQDAEDAMQNALMTLWKRWDRVCRHPNPQAMVLKICIDAAYDLTRHRSRHRRKCELTTLSKEPMDQSPTPSQAAEYSEQYHELMAVIQRMPRRQATATLMRVVQGQSYRDIASVLGCAEVTARKHVARGRERLHSALSRFDQSDTKASTTS
jgi:RNA polymerase sigma factor (sigma-70 family)